MGNGYNKELGNVWLEPKGGLDCSYRQQSEKKNNPRIAMVPRADRCGQPRPREPTGPEKKLISTSDSASRYSWSPTRPSYPSMPLLEVSERLVLLGEKKATNVSSMLIGSRKKRECLRLCGKREPHGHTFVVDEARRKLKETGGRKNRPVNQSVHGYGHESANTKHLNGAHGCLFFAGYAVEVTGQDAATNALVFTYTVLEGHETVALEVESADALVGTVRLDAT